MFFLLSTLVLVIIGVGLFYRRRHKIHIPLMISAFILDLGLVMMIEWKRHAIKTLSLGWNTPIAHKLLLFHVLVSVLTLLLYLSMMITGRMVVSGNRTFLKWHRRFAFFFIGCRLTNYFTSFFVGETHGQI